MSENPISWRAHAEMNAKIDEWIRRLHEIASAEVQEFPDRKAIRRASFVFGELRALSEEEVRSVVYCIGQRPILVAIGLLATIQQGVFHRQGDVSFNQQAIERGLARFYSYSEEERAAATVGLLKKLGSLYLEPVEPFVRAVPLELWQDLAEDFLSLVRERILEGKVVDYQDPRLRELMVRGRKYEEKFNAMGYPGMLKGMGR